MVPVNFGEDTIHCSSTQYKFMGFVNFEEITIQHMLILDNLIYPHTVFQRRLEFCCSGMSQRDNTF